MFPLDTANTCSNLTSVSNMHTFWLTIGVLTQHVSYFLIQFYFEIPKKISLNMDGRSVKGQILQACPKSVEFNELIFCCPWYVNVFGRWCSVNSFLQTLLVTRNITTSCFHCWYRGNTNTRTCLHVHATKKRWPIWGKRGTCVPMPLWRSKTCVELPSTVSYLCSF